MTAEPPYQDVLADVYDAWRAGEDIGRFVGLVLELAGPYLPAGRRLLDVGCGTGNTSVELARRGFAVTGCDASPAMLAVAAPGVAYLRADMRDLPAATFDVVTWIGDVANHLLTVDDLRAAFRSTRSVLAAGGVLAFDVVTSALYRDMFTRDQVVDRGSVLFAFAGTTRQVVPDGPVTGRLSAFVRDGDGRWSRRDASVVQRHYSDATVRRTLAEAGLACVAAAGIRTGLHRPPDETAHRKIINVARPV